MGAKPALILIEGAAALPVPDELDAPPPDPTVAAVALELDESAAEPPSPELEDPPPPHAASAAARRVA